jgi:hypothetical protein
VVAVDYGSRIATKGMNAVTIPVVVGADRRLIIDLPSSTPLGPAEVVIFLRSSAVDQPVNEAREAIRARLLAAKLLSTDVYAPPGTMPLSNSDLARLGQLPPNARPSETLVDEDRGAY